MTNEEAQRLVDDLSRAAVQYSRYSYICDTVSLPEYKRLDTNLRNARNALIDALTAQPADIKDARELITLVPCQCDHVWQRDRGHDGPFCRRAEVNAFLERTK